MRGLGTVVFLAGFATACGVDCTLVGCTSGLILELTATPTSAYHVEVQSSPAIGTRSYDCPTGVRCHIEETFDGFLPETATIIVSYQGRTQTTVVRPAYAQSSPNGKRCGPTCVSARVMVDLP